MHCTKTQRGRDEEDSHSKSVGQDQHDAQFTASQPGSSRLLRSRNINRNQLVYDLKYHPIDEYIQPLNAAKRRSASDNNVDNGYSTSEAETGPVQKRRKTLISSKPPRRTTRYVSHPKAAYDMKVHPQGAELGMLSANEADSDDNASDSSRDSSTEPCGPIAPLDKESVTARRLDELVTEAINCTVPNFATPESINYGIEDGVVERGQVVTERRTTRIDCLSSNDSHKSPHASGLSFDVYTEALEDQLKTEAIAASPFRFQHHDQENLSSTSQPESLSDTLDMVHVTPSSLHRRTSEDSHASHRLALLENVFNYGLESQVDPYGFRVAGNGDHDESTQKSSTMYGPAHR